MGSWRAPGDDGDERLLTNKKESSSCGTCIVQHRVNVLSQGRRMWRQKEKPTKEKAMEHGWEKAVCERWRLTF